MSEFPAEPKSQDVDSDEEGRMPFFAHLEELRHRLRNASVALLVGTAIAYGFRRELFALWARPFIRAWIEGQAELGLGKPELVFTSPVEAFMVLFKISLVMGVMLASPWIFLELWRFVSPGLYRNERRLTVGFVVASVLLFLLGVTFAYCFVLPAGYRYFLGYSATELGELKRVLGTSMHLHLSEPFAIRPMISMNEYFHLTAVLLLVFGAVFEMPLLLTVLALMGVITAAGLWRFNRFAIVLFAIAGAILTPGDLVVGQLAMTGALTVLYNLSILIVALVDRRHDKAVAAAQG